MPTDEAKEQASKILGLNFNKESELLHSFVRIGTGADDVKHKGKTRKKSGDDRKHMADIQAEDTQYVPTKTLTAKQIYNQIKKEMKEKEIRSKRIFREEEVYTDKDRAAAVNMGSVDIKNSLSMKMKQDKSKALKLPDEADPITLMALGRNEMRAGNTKIALNFFSKALNLNPENKIALVARSKCYLLLGEPKLAYDDAETALQVDKNYIKAIYQKAEALYFLGDFELSLMFYHRGLRIRPELEGFRLGVQKAQEAIENTIGSSQPLVDLKDLADSSMNSPVENINETKKSITPTSKSTTSKKNDSDKKLSRQLLGELSVDKEYLEKLLKHPDLNVGDRKSNNIAIHAEEAIQFLNKRQEFWRQQRPIGGGKRTNKVKDVTPLPKWFSENKML